MKPLQITNRTLTALLVLAILTVVGSIFLILAQLGYGTDFITGYSAFATGTVNITLLKTAGITLNFTNMSFGQGELNGDGTLTRVNNSASTIVNPSTFLTPMAFTLRVDGNTPVNISFNGTTAANFLGGTAASFSITVANNEAASAMVLVASQTEVTAAYKNLANNTNSNDASDEVNITVFLIIPADAPAAAKNATLDFKAVINSSSQSP